MSNSVQPHRQQPTRLPRPWDSPGKNTGVARRCLLQCMKVKSESEVTQFCPTLSASGKQFAVNTVSEVAQSCPTLCNPMDCSLPGSAIYGIFQARVLEWVAISFSRGSSRSGDRTQVSHIAARRFNL